MAFYQKVPGRTSGKRSHQDGPWEEEGTRYRGKSASAGSHRFGPNSERSERSERSEHGHGAKSYGRPEQDKRQGRSFGDRARGDNGDRTRRGINDRPHRTDRDFRPPVMPEEQARPSYLDHEYHAPVRPAAPVAPVEEKPEMENLLSGRNPIREALKSGRDIEKLLVQKGELSGSAREIVQMAREAHIPVQEVEKIRLDELTQHHQGMVAFASAYQYSTLEAMLEEAREKNEDPFLILLDGVTDPHNLGAIIRSAECVGAHGVIVPERRSVGLTPAAVKASAGAVEHLKVARVTNLNRTIEKLKEMGIWTYAVTMDGEDYEKVNFKGGVALVIGSEGEGISRLTEETCDCKVSLPMAGHLDSLNASVAAGVMMYRVFSSRRA